MKEELRQRSLNSEKPRENDNDGGESPIKVFNPFVTLADIATLATVAEGTLKNFLKEIRDKQQ